MVLASFSFKSSGTRVDDSVNNKDKELSLNNQTVGIKTPLTNFRGDQIFDMHNDFIDQIKDNLRNLLLTNRGERLGLYNFGTNLSELVFEYQNRKDFTQEITKRIIESTKIYIPAIEIDNIEVIKTEKSNKFELNKRGLAGVNLRVDFSIPVARVTNQSIAVELNPGG
tara:strand:+ start:785 stop:1288 length:504 start_codon:yes stop_codon:yes gene_type:complete